MEEFQFIEIFVFLNRVLSKVYNYFHNIIKGFSVPKIYATDIVVFDKCQNCAK